MRVNIEYRTQIKNLKQTARDSMAFGAENFSYGPRLI